MDTLDETMQTLQQAEFVDEAVKTSRNIWDVITENSLYYVVFLVVCLLILVKLVDLSFKVFSRKKSPMIVFLKSCIKGFLVVTIGFRICSLLPGVNDFTSQILLSSSLLVVVLGFVLQEGLSNIVHGFILSVFSPFKLQDRVTCSIDGEIITGYIREITIRHTVIQNVLNSAHVIVPNSKMDLCVITNNYYDGNTTSTSFLDLEITYESDLEKAIAVLRQAVEEHPLVKAAREEKHITEPVGITVRELARSGIGLRVNVITHTVEENFAACSDIRRRLVKIFALDPSLSFAYPHVQVVEAKRPPAGAAGSMYAADAADPIRP